MVMDVAHATTAAYEEEYVHAVYESIAQHFSSTRYKPWPVVENFLKELPCGSVGIDVGCGNGKYLSVNPNIFIVASDRSSNLVSIATRRSANAVVIADGLSLPHTTCSVDFAISIAVIHHFSSLERRVAAVRSVLAALRDGTGTALFYVWALEQAQSRRGWTSTDEQDVMVPWTTKSSIQPPDSSGVDGGHAITYQRYYHLYRQGELQANIRAAGGRVLVHGYEKDNWWAIACKA